VIYAVDINFYYVIKGYINQSGQYGLSLHILKDPVLGVAGTGVGMGRAAGS